MMDNDLFNLRHIPRRTFSKHFLNSVHCEFGLSRIDFKTILSEETYLKTEFEKLGFQENKKVFQGHYLFASHNTGAIDFQQKSEPIGLQFGSQKPKRHINVTEKSILVSDFDYDGFESFLQRLKEFIQLVGKVLGKRDVNKVGLRKINSIITEPVESYADACSIFNTALFGLLRSGLPVPESISATEEVIVLETQGKLSLLRNRFTKRDKPNSYEANLDFDLVDTTEQKAEDALNVTLPKLNDIHFDLFMWAVTPDMIELMERK